VTSDKHIRKHNALFKNFSEKAYQFFKLLNNTDNLSIIGIIIPLVTLVALGYVLYQTISAFISHIEILENRMTLSPMLERMLLYLVDGETGQRGYLITGNTKYLEHYNMSLRNIDNQVQTLLEVTSSNQSQQDIIKEKVIPLIDKRLEILHQSINLNGRGLNVTSPLNNTTLIDEGKRNMDEIRTIIQGLENDQNNFLKNSSEALERESNSLLSKLLVLILVIFIITAITIFTINHKIRNRNLEVKRKLQFEITKSTKEIRESNIKLKKLNEQLKKHDKLQRDFINIAAHELRTPCQTIAGYSEMALCDENYKAVDLKHGQFITSINKSVSRLQDLTERILDVAKIESNSLPLNMQKIDVIEEIKNITKEFGKEIENKNGKMFVKTYYRNKNNANENDVKIKLIIPTHPVIVKIDKLQIYQVMSNLLNNALKAALDNKLDIKHESIITISVETRNDNDTNEKNKDRGYGNSNQFVFVSVTDSGKGIPKELFPNLFSKFVSFTEKGIGLGLFISKSIIELHGGKMRAYNSHIEGQGATVEFAIPYDPTEKES
jgi:signal transduction histidine kinase